MAFKALDHSSRLTDPAGFANTARIAGYSAILRYLPIPYGTLAHDAVGRLTAAEITAYHAAGLGVGVVWETTQYRPLDGASAGLVDGPAARTAANNLGFPSDHPIYGAVDFNPTSDQWPAIAAYLGKAGFEPYANGPTCAHLLTLGFGHFWMHNWGGCEFADPHLHQQGGQVTIAGIICDLNDGYYDDCVWWPPIPVPPQPIPKPGDAIVQKFNPPLHIGAHDTFAIVKPASGGAYEITPDGHVFAWGCTDIGMPAGHTYWGSRVVLDVQPLGANGFTIYGRLGNNPDGKYDYPGPN